MSRIIKRSDESHPFLPRNPLQPRPPGTFPPTPEKAISYQSINCSIFTS